VFQLHRVAQAVNFEIGKGAGQHALQSAQVFFSIGFTRRRCSDVAIRHQLQCLRPGLAKTSRLDTKHVLAHVEAGHRAYHIAIFRPHVQHAPIMLG